MKTDTPTCRWPSHNRHYDEKQLSPSCPSEQVARLLQREAGVFRCPPLVAVVSLMLAVAPWEVVKESLGWVISGIVAIGAAVGTVKHWKTLIEWIREGKWVPKAVQEIVTARSTEFSNQLLEKPGRTTVRFTLFIRFGVLIGFFSTHSLRLFSNQQVLASDGVLWKATTWNVAIFSLQAFICTLLAFMVSLKSFEAARIIDSLDPALTPDQMEKKRLSGREILFGVALLDVVIMFFAGLWPAEIVSDAHLGYFVAAASAWQLPKIRDVILLFSLILLGLIGRWLIVGSICTSPLIPLVSGVDYPQSYPWLNTLVLNVLPKVFIWGFLAFLCVVLISTRKSSEARHVVAVKNETMFRGLAEALPFDVFVKNQDFTYEYVNQQMLEKLKKFPQNADLVCERVPDKEKNCIQGRSDKDLGIAPEVADIFNKADKRVIENKETLDREIEPDFVLGPGDLVGDYPKVRTRKVQLKDRNGSPLGLVGFCEDAMILQNAMIYDAIMDFRRHYFFQKDRNGIFTWASEHFWEDAGKPNRKDRGNVTDADIYSKELAKAYRDADELLIAETEKLDPEKRRLHFTETEEWHRFADGREQRVMVRKKPILDPQGNVTGVQGCFCKIEDSTARRALMERALGVLFPELALRLRHVLKRLPGAAGKIANGMPAKPYPNGKALRGSNPRGSVFDGYLGEFDFILWYLEVLTPAVQLVNLDEWQLEQIEKEAKDLCWKPDKPLNVQRLQDLGKRLRDWRGCPFELRVEKQKGVDSAKVDNRWVFAIATIYWINAAQAAGDMNDSGFWVSHPSRKGCEKEPIVLEISMLDSSLLIEVSGRGEAIPKSKTPKDLSRPRLQGDRTMGIGLEIVWRIAQISGGSANCQPWPGGNGSIFTFQCPVSP
ncbi:hypothetical protein [Luteolibacter soli]|uniref:Histidine kinase/HSP90-like ATPase domain-containing protein n=1 Tax=Luteolibacter soli TaxID=3135280 RepID=A0ABU9AVI2_9BACT